MDLENFRYVHQLSVRFADADIMKHVNNAKYHTYLEEARWWYVDSVCHAGEPPVHDMILAKTVMDYLAPLFVGETVNVYVRCSRLGRKSFDLEYMILNSQGQLACTAMTTLVGYNYQTKTSVMISDVWRERMLAFEKVPPAGI